MEELGKENEDKRERIPDKRRKLLVQGTRGYQEPEEKKAKIREYNQVKKPTAPWKRPRYP